MGCRVFRISSRSPLTASLYIMGIRGVTLSSRRAGPRRAAQGRAAAMIVSELRQLSGCFPKSSTVHGRPECAAAQDLSSICLRDSFIVIAADLSRRAGPWGGLGSVGMPTIGKKLGHAGHVGRRGPTVSMTCDMRRLSFDARKTPLGGILDQPAVRNPRISTKLPRADHHLPSVQLPRGASWGPGLPRSCQGTQSVMLIGLGAPALPGGTSVRACPAAGTQCLRPPGGSHLSKNGLDPSAQPERSPAAGRRG